MRILSRVVVVLPVFCFGAFYGYAFKREVIWNSLFHVVCTLALLNCDNFTNKMNNQVLSHIRTSNHVKHANIKKILHVGNVIFF